MAYNLPVLDYAATLYGDVSLRDTVIVARQHLLATTFDLFEKLFEKGLKPENVFLLGKCYSTNKDIEATFRAKGVYVHPGSHSFDSHMSFDEQSLRSIEELFARANAKFGSGIEKLLIIDDGGDLHLFANRYAKFGEIAGVEQTTSGLRKLERANINYPIINVARSEAKLTTESPMIAEVITRNLMQYLDSTKPNPEKVLIMGSGAIGNCIYELLNSRFNVTKHDLIKNKSDIASESELKLQGYDVIIGCTGETIINPNKYGLLKHGTVLASASSSDVEFSAVNLRRLISKTDKCHEVISVNNINLLNSGFPINFNGDKHSVSPEKIQFTRALMLAGICQAQQTDYGKGLIELDQSIQNMIINKYQELSLSA